LEAKKGAERGTNQRYKRAKYGDGAGNDVGDDGDTAGAAKPSAPMDEAISVEVLRATEYTEEDILCGDLNRLSVNGKEGLVFI
jgi:hypothetical protein